MDHETVLNEFRGAEALLEGHFILSSGKHSDRYLQCARVMMEPKRAARLLTALATKVRAQIDQPIDMIVAPAMGGVIVGYELARHLDVPTVFMERVDGEFILRRGFEITKGARILMVEDIVTTGLSSRECIAAITQCGGTVVGGACLIDRSDGKADIGVKLVPLTGLEVMAWEPDDLPDHLKDSPAIKPGSRGLKS